MKTSMCTCASHCTLNTYHEKACCDKPACDCWCHGEIKLYMDDERQTPEGWFRTYTVAQTIYWLQSRRVTHLSLDNDLGLNQPEGYKVMDWLEEIVHNDKSFPIPVITIHTSNAARALYMKAAVEKLETIRQEQLQCKSS